MRGRFTGPGACLLALVVVGCGPRMDDQPSHAPYETVFPPRPAGVVARRAEAHDPGLPTGPRRGALVYERYCTPCHGVDGRGDGPVAPALGMPPRDLLEPSVQAMSEEEIAAAVANGSGLMFPLRHLVLPSDRRAVARHVLGLDAEVEPTP